MLAIITVLVASALHFGPDFHASRFFLMIMVIVGLSVRHISRRFGAPIGIACGWALGSAALVFAWPNSPYLPFGDLAVSALNASAVTSFAMILAAATLLPQLIQSKNSERNLLNAFRALCLIDSILVLGQWALGESSTDRGGLFVNAGTNACMIACTYPILTSRYVKPKTDVDAIVGLIAILIPPLAIVVSRSNMGLLALLAAFIAPVAISAVRRRTAKVPWLAVVIVLIGVWVLGPKFGDNNGRLNLWHQMFSWWYQHANHWLGTGLGSFAVLGPSVQMSLGFPEQDFFVWMHNDWLQILFEQGFIGLTLSVIAFGFALRCAFRSNRAWLLSSLCAYGVTMCGNFPIHLPIPGLLGATLVALAFS